MHIGNSSLMYVLILFFFYDNNIESPPYIGSGCIDEFIRSGCRKTIDLFDWKRHHWHPFIALLSLEFDKLSKEMSFFFKSIHLQLYSILIFFCFYCYMHNKLYVVYHHIITSSCKQYSAFIAIINWNEQSTYTTMTNSILGMLVCWYIISFNGWLFISVCESLCHSIPLNYIIYSSWSKGTTMLNKHIRWRRCRHHWQDILLMNISCFQFRLHSLLQIYQKPHTPDTHTRIVLAILFGLTKQITENFTMAATLNAPWIV